MSARAFAEESWILVGEVHDGLWFGRLISHQIGQPHTVGFSWRRALAREERYGDVVGFLHTHPRGLLGPSARDVRTMTAWASCLGKRLLCGIVSGDEIAAYIFTSDGDHRGARVARLATADAIIAAEPRPDDYRRDHQED